MRRAQLEGLTIKTALALGFGLTLGVWLFAGSYFTRRIADIQRDADIVNARYMRAQELLTSVRSQILLGSLAVRDALLDPDNGGVQRAERQIGGMFTGVDAALEKYVPILDSQVERERVERLRREVAELGGHMNDVLAASMTSPADARRLLNSTVVPRRDLVIRVSDQAQALNRTAFVEQQNAVAAIYRATQRRLWTQLGLALGASLAIALLATIYAGRLESRLRQQREREIRHAEDLQRLSAKLISAQEEERRGIARELHDELGQVLSAIKVDIALARRGLENSEPAHHLLEDAELIADGAITTVRDLSHLLHPSVLDDLGLPAAVESYLRGFGNRYGIRAELLSDRMEQRLQPETEVTAYRIIQEALTNVARHSKATACRVYLQRLPSTILITIEDNGSGFNAAEAQRPEARQGLGLLGIRERASLLQGTLRVESTRGTGTRLTVELPAATRPATAGDDADAADSAPLSAPETVHG